MLENKLGITNSIELAKEEERITKIKATELFENKILDKIEVGTYKGLAEIHKYLLKNALTDKINDREVYMKGIDTSYNYEGYNLFNVKDLKK